MKTNLLSRLKTNHLETLHREEVKYPTVVKNILTTLEEKEFISTLTISEVIDIINYCDAPTNDYNYVWEMFNDK
tara:strand:- start:64 stop:285 length:222 start_codon:yes stop_codon:yes gene_type:complete